MFKNTLLNAMEAEDFKTSIWIDKYLYSSLFSISNILVDIFRKLSRGETLYRNDGEKKFKHVSPSKKKEEIQKLPWNKHTFGVYCAIITFVHIGWQLIKYFYLRLFRGFIFATLRCATIR